MALALKLPVQQSTNRGSVGKEILQVAEKDYKALLVQIADQEVQQQKQLGNPPSLMLVDGQKGKSVESVQKSIVVYFADRATLAAGIAAAFAAVQTNGRRITGGTIGKLNYYYSVGKGGRITPVADPRGAVASTPNPRALDLYVALQAPHVRKWQWLSRGGVRMTRTTRDKTRTKGARVSMSVFEYAAKQVQARFKNLTVRFMYLNVGNLNPGGRTAVDRIPAIVVKMKYRRG